MKHILLITKYLFLLILLPAMIFLGTACKEKKQNTPSRLIIQTFPANAKVFILGEERGKKLRVPPGTYILKFTCPAYKDTWKKVEVPRGKTVDVNCSLEKETSDVMICSNPAKAEVIYNGKRMGLTPVVISGLQHGKYSAKVSAPGYSEKDVSWEIDSSVPVKINAVLESNMGILTVNSIPSGAEVLLNGKIMGRTPMKERIPAGDYEIVLRKKDYMPLARKIVISRNKSLSMGRLQMEIRRGSIRVTSVPSGGKVYLDNREYGSTPCTLQDLMPGQYSIRVEKSGFDSSERMIRLNPGARLAEHVILDSNRSGVDVITQPANLTLYLDGILLGRSVPDPKNTRLSKLFPIRNISTGTHKLTAYHKRGRPQKKTISFKTEKGKILRLDTIRIWVPNARITYNNSNLAQDVRIVQTFPDGSVYLEPGPGIGTKIQKNIIRNIEYLKDEIE